MRILRVTANDFAHTPFKEILFADTFSQHTQFVAEGDIGRVFEHSPFHKLEGACIVAAFTQQCRLTNHQFGARRWRLGRRLLK